MYIGAKYLEDMRLVDPYRVKISKPKTQDIIVSETRQGTAKQQGDSIEIFTDECVVVASGLSDTAHGDIVSRTASETALWAYKHIRLHPSFWVDKKQFMKRIFRSSNMAVWQKLREKECEGGGETTLTVAMIGPTHIWVGQAGDTGIYQYREGRIQQITSYDRDPNGKPKHTLGVTRLGLIHEYASREFLPHDAVIILTRGAWEQTDNALLTSVFEKAGGTEESLARAVELLLDTLMKRGGKNNMSAVIIKRLPAV